MTSTPYTLTSAYYQPFNKSQSSALVIDDPRDRELRLPTSEDEQLLAEAQKQTYNLQFLAPGWNGYDGLPPSAAVVDQAMRWLVSSYAECKDVQVRWYKPNVTASAEGEVVFWWVAEDRSLSVYIDEEGATFHQSLEGGGPTQHTHGEAPLGTRQSELLRWFSE